MSDPPATVLAAWSLAGAACDRLGSGHINSTFRVTARGVAHVLQRLSPIFGVEVNEDIEAVTRALEGQGLCTPRLVRTTAGDLWHVDGEGAVWRLMTFIEGQTLLEADSPARCAAAGRMLGRFHRALWDLEHRFRSRRLGVHDTPRHLENLRRALRDHGGHRLFAAIEPVGRGILEAAGGLDLTSDLPERVVHGDPKISNFIFDPKSGEAVALVDLDTLARMPLPVELGDALRSWCAPRGEEIEGPIDLGYFEAAMAGYAGAVGDLPTGAERRAVCPGVERIAVELAARFCADALQESYFGWDPARFAGHAEHNLARARSQLSLARSVRSVMAGMERLVQGAWLTAGIHSS